MTQHDFEAALNAWRKSGVTFSHPENGNCIVSSFPFGTLKAIEAALGCGG